MKMQLLILISFFTLGQTFAVTELGKKVDPKNLTPISKLISTPQDFDGKEVTISGMVTDVCSMRGCWMKFASDEKYQTLMLKVKDGDMVFPLSAKGKLAYATGTLSHKTYTADQLIAMEKERAKEQKREPKIEEIKGPKTFYQFSPVGVRID